MTPKEIALTDQGVAGLTETMGNYFASLLAKQMTRQEALEMTIAFQYAMFKNFRGGQPDV